MKNEAINVLFSQIMEDTAGTETKMTACFIKMFHYFWPFFQQYERTTLNDVCK